MVEIIYGMNVHKYLKLGCFIRWSNSEMLWNMWCWWRKGEAISDEAFEKLLYRFKNLLAMSEQSFCARYANTLWQRAQNPYPILHDMRGDHDSHFVLTSNRASLWHRDETHTCTDTSGFHNLSRTFTASDLLSRGATYLKASASPQDNSARQQ